MKVNEVKKAKVRRLYINSMKYRCYRQGSVLVFVLIVISCMTIIAFGMAYQTRIEMRLSKSSSQQTKIWYLALAGLQSCKAILAQSELSPEQTAKVCRFYSANDNGKLFEQLKLRSDEGIQLICWIRDENGFLDLNKSDSASWENLSGFTRDKRACILDWKDPDSDTNPDGAETDFYERLEPSYSCKNASLISLKELLFVKNITRDDYLGSILKDNLTNSDDTKILFDEDLTQPSPFIDLFTVYGRDKVNINTVSAEILSALPDLDQQTADVVLAFRAGPDGQEHTDDDVIIENTEDISQIEDLTELQIELLGQYCCFNSSLFRVFCYAKVNTQSCFLMATIKAAGNKPRIISVERLL